MDHSFACFRSLIAVGLTVALAATASAATLEVGKGKALVNRGQGFKGVSASTQLNPGDSVVVKDGGSAEIVYDALCRVAVSPGNVVVVQAGCPAAVISAAGAPAIDAGVLAGIAVVGGGVGLAVALSSGSSSSSSAPASP